MSRQPREERQQPESPRRKRVPVGVPRLKLNAPNREGYVRRWVNDDNTRLKDFEEGGYQYVYGAKAGDAAGNDVTAREGLDSRVSRVVGKKDDGSPLTAYLMEIRQDWYDEDQLAKMRIIDEKEAQMRRGEDSQGGRPGHDGRYVPREGITIER